MHAPVWLHLGRSFSMAEHVPAERLFAGVAYVMVARGEENAGALLAIYAAPLAAAFEEIAANADWRLLRRRAPA